MLYINPDDFVMSLNNVSRKLSTRTLLRKAAHSVLEADEILGFRELTRQCVVFGEVGLTTRVVYLRSDDRSIIVREFTNGEVSTAYDVSFELSTRDMNLELSVIDGVICFIERTNASALLKRQRMATNGG